MLFELLLCIHSCFAMQFVQTDGDPWLDEIQNSRLLVIESSESYRSPWSTNRLSRAEVIQGVVPYVAFVIH